MKDYGNNNHNSSARDQINTNSGTLINPDQEEGHAFLSSGNEKQVRAVSRSVYAGSYLYEVLGTKISDTLIRQAHGLCCVYCGEPVGELKDNNGVSYGFMHYPEGESYTFCKAGPLGEVLKNRCEATPKGEGLK